MKKLLFSLLLIGCAQTQYILKEDNDYFKLSGNHDRNYSQGLRITGDTLDASGSTAYYVGQNFYTPGHKQITDPQPHDRPYAAYLYGGGDFKYRQSENVQDTLGITVGIVGPHAYGEQAQNRVHKLLGQNTAKGWSNQIHDEPGLILTAQRKVALPIAKYFNIVNTFGGNLGNVFTQAYTGALFQFGFISNNLFDNDVVYPRTVYPFSNSWAAYLFAGPYARAVLQNIFLDGNTFRDSTHIAKEPFVGEGRAGFALEYDRWKFAYTYIVQSAEFKGEEVRNDFGEISLSTGW